jgi:hypothetical protein
MKALPKDQQYPAILRSGRGPHSEVQRRNSDTMWLLIIACGIVLTMWVVDELVGRVWGPSTVNEQTAWRFESRAELSRVCDAPPADVLRSEICSASVVNCFPEKPSKVGNSWGDQVALFDKGAVSTRRQSSRLVDAPALPF